MLDPATLAEWEADWWKVAHTRKGEAIGDCACVVLNAIAEIRRLREELKRWQDSRDDMVLRAQQSNATLAAHRAVVRELRTALKDVLEGRYKGRARRILIQSRGVVAV